MEDNKNNISRDQQQPPHRPLALSLSSSSQPPSLPSQPIFPPLLQIPISHVKRIVRSDPDVVMVSSDAPVLLAKACEMFIADLTNRAWLNARENKCNMIRKPDVINALATHEPCGFLLDLFPKEEPVHLEPVAPSNGDGADEAGPRGTANDGGN